MAKFGKLILTNEGLELQNRLQAGELLTFTAIGMGSGKYEGQIQMLENLVDERVKVNLTKGEVANDMFTVQGNFTNETIDVGFEWREIGLYAQGPDRVEKLYCYANAGSNFDYIPATKDERYEKIIRISTIVSNSDNVTILTPQSIYVESIEFDAYKESQIAALSKKADLGLDGKVKNEQLPDFKVPEGTMVESKYATGNARNENKVDHSINADMLGGNVASDYAKNKDLESKYMNKPINGNIVDANQAIFMGWFKVNGETDNIPENYPGFILYLEHEHDSRQGVQILYNSNHSVWLRNIQGGAPSGEWTLIINESILNGKNFQTAGQVDAKINDVVGNINTILDRINGEVI